MPSWRNAARRQRPIDVTRCVLDASTVLAVVFEEAGTDAVSKAIRSVAAMSAVNAAEVAARLHEDGWLEAEVALVLDEIGIEILPFDHQCALLSGRYRPATRSLGLGLGDRACLTTANLQQCPALTADRAWEALDIGVEVVCIR